MRHRTQHGVRKAACRNSPRGSSTVSFTEITPPSSAVTFPRILNILRKAHRYIHARIFFVGPRWTPGQWCVLSSGLPAGGTTLSSIRRGYRRYQQPTQSWWELYDESRWKARLKSVTETIDDFGARINQAVWDGGRDAPAVARIVSSGRLA
jgi:hypothetical protein